MFFRNDHVTRTVAVIHIGTGRIPDVSDSVQAELETDSTYRAILGTFLTRTFEAATLSRMGCDAVWSIEGV